MLWITATKNDSTLIHRFAMLSLKEKAALSDGLSLNTSLR